LDKLDGSRNCKHFYPTRKTVKRGIIYCAHREHKKRLYESFWLWWTQISFNMFEILTLTYVRCQLLTLMHKNLKAAAKPLNH
jgi:hypothetical protein